MTPHLETLATIGQDLDDARSKIVAVKESLQTVPQDTPAIRRAIERLERMEAELARIEAGIVVREGLA